MLVKYSLFVNWLCRLVLALLVVATVTGSAFAQSTGTIRGAIFEDLDGDKIQSEEDLGIQTSFVITSPITGHVAVASQENGYFLLSGLEPGIYNITPPMISGYSLFGGESGFASSVEVKAGQQTLVAMPFQRACAEFKILEIKCNVTPDGVFTGYSVTFEYTNLGTIPIKKLVFTPPAGTLIQYGAALPNTVPFFTPVNFLDTVTRTVTITGVTPGWKCFAGSQHNASGSSCCNISLCASFPVCDCFQMTGQTFNALDANTVQWCFTLQNLSKEPSKGIKFLLPAGVAMTPNPLDLSSATGPLLPYQSKAACVTITGAALGAQLCFDVVLAQDAFEIEVCRRTVCIEIPKLNLCVGTGECYKAMPTYFETGTNNVLPEWQNGIRSLGNTVAAITCWAQNGNDPVFAMINLDRYQCGSFIKGKNWTASATQRNNYHGYHGKPDVGTSAYNWTRKNLGTVFGIEIDTRGNCYLSHTSANNGTTYTYNPSTNSWPITNGNEALAGVSGGPGSVHVIQNNTGLISKFVELPMGPAQVVFGPATSAGLGNIAFDKDHNQFFVTDHYGYGFTVPFSQSIKSKLYNEGRIYRVASNASGTVGTISAPDSSKPTVMFMDGKSRMNSNGTQFWGIAVHRKRLYVSRWMADQQAVNFSGTFSWPSMQPIYFHNEIWSAPIEANGDVIESKFRLELTIPFLSGRTYSNPVADIEFDETGVMYLAEKSMNGLSNIKEHQSRVLAFECDSGSWVQLARLDQNNVLQTELCFQTGMDPSWATSSVGGVAPDFNKCGGSIGGNRLWATGDILADYDGNPTTTDFVYGLTGMPYTGGKSQDEILIAGSDIYDPHKAIFNEVDIPCYMPGKGTLLVTLQGFTPSVDDIVLGWVEIRDSVTNELIDKWQGNIANHPTFEFRGNFPPKNYDVVVKGSQWLSKRIKDIYLESGLNAEVVGTLLSGDCDNDNYVGTNDYLILSESFDAGVGEPKYDARADLDRDGAVTTNDYLLLNENFDETGE